MCFCLSCHLEIACSNENCTNDICPICENAPEETHFYRIIDPPIPDHMEGIERSKEMPWWL